MCSTIEFVTIGLLVFIALLCAALLIMMARNRRDRESKERLEREGELDQTGGDGDVAAAVGVHAWRKPRRKWRTGRRPRASLPFVPIEDLTANYEPTSLPDARHAQPALAASAAGGQTERQLTDWVRGVDTPLGSPLATPLCSPPASPTPYSKLAPSTPWRTATPAAEAPTAGAYAMLSKQDQADAIAHTASGYAVPVRLGPAKGKAVAHALATSESASFVGPPGAGGGVSAYASLNVAHVQ